MAPVIHGHGIGGRVFSMYQFGLSAYDKEFQRLEPLGTLIRVDISASAPMSAAAATYDLPAQRRIR
jgi:hypothetical protein